MTTPKLPTPAAPDADDAEAVFNETSARLADPYPVLARLLEETRAMLPARLKNDRYWLPCTLIFHAVFPTHIPTYFNFDIPQIDIPRFNKKTRGYLSHGEGILADLAFHLYNDANRLPRNGLTNLRALDAFHFELALLAIRLACDLSTPLPLGGAGGGPEVLKGSPMTY